MCNTIKTLFISVTVSLGLLGCSGESESHNDGTLPHPNPGPQSQTTEPPNPVQNQSGAATTSQTIALAGITIEVNIKGTLSPSAEYDVELVQTSGNPAIAIRLWIGDKSGIGSTKTRVHSHGDSYHAELRSPSTLPANSALWIEVQSAMGERESGSIALK